MLLLDLIIYNIIYHIFTPHTESKFTLLRKNNNKKKNTRISHIQTSLMRKQLFYKVAILYEHT